MAKAKKVSAPNRNLAKTPKWPVERDVLFKPDRLEYVRKLKPHKGCVFCAALKEGASAETLLLGDDGISMVIMNKFPYNSGHLLVLPMRHCGDMLAMTPEELASLSKHVQLCIRALTETYKPPGFNVGLNLGSAAGAGIPDHLHYHVIPRWNGDTNFFPLIAKTKVAVETLEQTYKRLKKYF